MEIKVIKDVMEANNAIAENIKKKLWERKTIMINIIGSPGSGKTTFILETIKNLNIKSAVIEGDITSDIDAKKVAEVGVPVIQINTGGSCHLNANMIDAALEEIPGDKMIIFVENIGNIVCPANFDIGEDFKIALSSITEGDDKPYKYPAIFERARAVILNKIDLVPYVKFDKEFFYDGIETLNPNAATFEVASISGEGIRVWTKWLKDLFIAKCETMKGN